MLDESRLFKELWAKAVVTANYTRNRIPVCAHGKTSWEAYCNEKPTVGHMRVFGAQTHMHVQSSRDGSYVQ